MNDEYMNEETNASPSEEAHTTQPSGSGGSSKTILAVLIVIVLIISALELSGTTSIFSGNTVATVNGEKISQKEFDNRKKQIFASEQVQLVNLDDEEVRASIEAQILDEIINTRLLLQVAKDAGITVTSDQIEAEYTAILIRLGGEGSTEEEQQEVLTAELEKSGLTDTAFRKNIGEQLIIEEYFDRNLDASALEVTNEEIELYYAQVASEQDNVPPLEEVRTEVETGIVSQKRLQAVSILIATLRESADITITEAK